MKHQGFVPTEVWAEEDRLVVQSLSEWWLQFEEQPRLRVEPAERTDAGLAITRAPSRWWDWGRYKARVEPEEAEVLDAWLAKVVQT